MPRHIVATAKEIPEGGRKLVTIGNRPIAVFHTNGAYFAVYDRCPHEGGSLCAGKLTGLVQSDRPGRLPARAQGRDRPLPLARLGVRSPHRPVVLRPAPVQGEELRGRPRRRRRGGGGPVPGHHLQGERRRGLRLRRGLSAAVQDSAPRPESHSPQENRDGPGKACLPGALAACFRPPGRSGCPRPRCSPPGHRRAGRGRRRTACRT